MAVSVTTIPAEMDVIALPPLVTDNVVVVAVWAKAGAQVANDNAKVVMTNQRKRENERRRPIRGPVE